MNTNIKLAENIYWKVDSDTQPSETMEWVNENVLRKLGLDQSDPSFIYPEKDAYGRPIRWKYITDKYTIEVTREYIYPNSNKWARKSDKINVVENGSE